MKPKLLIINEMTLSSVHHYLYFLYCHLKDYLFTDRKSYHVGTRCQMLVVIVLSIQSLIHLIARCEWWCSNLTHYCEVSPLLRSSTVTAQYSYIRGSAV